MKTNLLQKDNKRNYKLKELVVKMKTGGTPLSSRKDFYDGEISFVKIADMTRSGKFILDTKIKITEDGLKGSSSWLVPKNSILYSIYATVGDVAINKIELATNQAIMGIIPDESMVDRDYLYYSLVNYKKKLAKYFKETTQKNLTSSIVGDLDIMLPSVEEQKKIARILSKIDDDIEKVSEIIKQTTKLKSGLMSELFSISKLKNNDWKAVELEKISEIIMGQSPSSASYNKDKIGLPFFQGKADFAKGNKHPVVRQWTSNPTKISESGSILFTVRAPVGELFFNNVRACIGRGLASIKVKDGNSQEFLYYFLQSKEAEFNKLSQGSTFTAINSRELRNIKVIIPMPKKQREIASILSKIDEKIDIYKEIKSKLEILKKGLMQDLLN